MARVLRAAAVKAFSFPKPSPLSSAADALPPAPLVSPFTGRLAGLLQHELDYLADRRPSFKALPLSPPSTLPVRPNLPERFKSFVIEDRPGEQWVRLRSGDVKVDATMFDAMEIARPEEPQQGPSLHISLIAEVTRGDSVFGIVCSAWPNSLVVRDAFPLRHRGVAQVLIGRRIRRMNYSLREELEGYLKEREVDDELAEFLHEYITNKNNIELFRWFQTIQKFVLK